MSQRAIEVLDCIDSARELALWAPVLAVRLARSNADCRQMTGEYVAAMTGGSPLLFNPSDPWIRRRAKQNRKRNRAARRSRRANRA